MFLFTSVCENASITSDETFAQRDVVAQLGATVFRIRTNREACSSLGREQGVQERKREECGGDKPEGDRANTVFASVSVCVCVFEEENRQKTRTRRREGVV